MSWLTAVSARMPRAGAGLAAGCLAVALLGCGSEAEVPEPQPEAACESAVPCFGPGTRSLDIGGVRVLHRPLPGHPLVAMHVAFNAENGSGWQAWSETLALELLMVSGPRRFDLLDWRTELSRLHGSLQAYADVDYGAIQALAPQTYWRELWDLMVEGIAQPHSDSYVLGQLLSYYQRSFTSEGDEPDTAAQADAASRLFRGRPAELRRATRDVLASISIADTHAAWAGLTSRGRMLVTIVGDVSERELQQAVNSLLRVSHAEPYQPFAAEPRTAAVPGAESIILPYPGSPTWHVVSYFDGPDSGSPDRAAFELGLSVLDRRLFRAIREERGLAYTTGARALPFRQSAGTIWVSSPLPREALPVLQGTVAELKAQGPSEGELAAARAQLRTGLLANSDEPSDLAFTLSDWTLREGGPEAIDAYFGQLEAASSADVQAALAAYVRDVKTTAAGDGDTLGINDLIPLYVDP